jgi:hypothetical protein
MAFKVVKKSDLLDMQVFAQLRKEKRAEMTTLKRIRRVAVGPDASFLFESYDTMWWQIHEMLFIEKGGADQIPQGNELVATLMFEVDDPERRKSLLMKLGGVEETCCLNLNEEIIVGDSETDVDRTSAAGKASSVQFIHFKLSDLQIDMFKKPETKISVGITHPAYGHRAVISEDVRTSLITDFD